MTKQKPSRAKAHRLASLRARRKRATTRELKRGRAAAEPIGKTYSDKLAMRMRRQRVLLKMTPPLLAERLVREAGKDGIKIKPREAVYKIWNWESGRYRIPLDMLPALSRALGLRNPAGFMPPA